MTVDLSKTPFLQGMWDLNGWWWMARALRVDGAIKRWIEVGVCVTKGEPMAAVGDLNWYDEITEDWEVYWCPHPTIEPIRKKEYVNLGTYVVADVDDGLEAEELSGLIPRPTVCVQTSPGRYQAVWRLTRPATRSVLRGLSMGLASITNADAGSASIPKFIRLAPSWNHKTTPPEPVMVLWNNGPVHDPADLPYIAEDAAPGSEIPDFDLGDPVVLVQQAAERLGPVAGPELKGCWYASIVYDRSKLIWKMINLMLESGASEEETFVVCWSWKWNKFKSRSEGKEQLWQQIKRAQK